MLNKSIMRNSIIKFFTNSCNNKLNKNMYLPSYYKNRNASHIYTYIELFYKNTPLECASLAQKYYHLFWNIDPNDIITSTKFYNFSRGYKKNKRTVLSKSRKWLEENINSYKTQHIKTLPKKDNIVNQLKKYLKLVQYKQLYLNKELLDAVLFLQNKLVDCTNFEKIIYFYNNVNNYKCECGANRSIKSPTYVNQTCGSKKCLSTVLTAIGKKRNLSYLQSPEIKLKRVVSRSWYKHTPQTIEKIRNTNKKTWTKEKRRNLVIKNKASGVYEKVSCVLKDKILSGRYTPKTNNRFVRKRLYSHITGVRRYRSTWEVKYHEKFPNLQYEFLRVPYKDNNAQKIFIVDFWDSFKKEAIEIKPSNLTNTLNFKAKIEGLSAWCKANNAYFKIVTEKDFNFYEL